MKRTWVFVLAFALGLAVEWALERWSGAAVLEAYRRQNAILWAANDDQAVYVQRCNEERGAIWPRAVAR